MGALTYKGPGKIQANSMFDAELEIRVGEKIETGGRFAIAVRHVSDFGDAQTENKNDENFVTISSNRKDTEFETDSDNNWDRHPWNRGFEIILTKGTLYPGDIINIKLGGERGYRCQSFVESRFVFRLGVKCTPDSEWRVLPESDCPGFEISGNEPARVKLHVRDVNSDKPTGKVCIKIEDSYGNPASVGELEMDLILDDKKFITGVRLCEGMNEIRDIALPNDGKWHTITAVDKAGKYFSRSNPYGPSMIEEYKLYWGEIHCQSGLCDGTNNPKYLYEYGKKAAGLDFASVTSHDMELTPGDWEEIKKATKEANSPYDYVTFLGYEWSGAPERGGDNNVYFLGDDGPLLYNGPYMENSKWLDSTQYIEKIRTIKEVLHELGDMDYMVIPHCGGRLANFDFYDDRKMPVFEIHSCHRNYEDIAFKAIERGIKFGFIGGSDDHRGSLGDSVPSARERFFSSHSGLVAVYAKELTRESIWEAIFSRRTYATNGCKAALSFKVNGVVMGSDIQVEAGENIKFEFEVTADSWFDRAELVCRTETVARFSKNLNQIKYYKETYEDKAKEGTNAYYLRVYQTDGGVAWTSPVWVTGLAKM